MVVLDPNEGGCTVYNDMMASYIKGNPSEVCRQVIERVCCGVDYYGRPRQVITVGLVMGGIGACYKDAFINMGLSHIAEIPCKHIELVLPKFCDTECGAWKA